MTAWTPTPRTCARRSSKPENAACLPSKSLALRRGLSSVKRYAKTAREGGSLRPKASPGRPPKADERARRLLEADLKERPAATLSERREYLRGVGGLRVSESTVSRLLGRMGWSRKEIGGCGGARRVLEGRLAGAGRREDRSEPLVVRRRDGLEHVAGAPVCLVATGERAAGTVPRDWGANVTLLASMSASGMGPSLAVEGATTRGVFETYLERVLAPTLSPGQVVVMDNLSAHKGGRVREIVEGCGCELLYLPPYSPDLNPIEGAFSKLKGRLRAAAARSREALVEAMGTALDATTAGDARAFFGGCGYRTAAQSL